MQQSASVAEILQELNERGEVSLTIKFAKKDWMSNPMLRFAIEQAKILGIDIHITGVTKA